MNLFLDESYHNLNQHLQCNISCHYSLLTSVSQSDTKLNTTNINLKLSFQQTVSYTLLIICMLHKSWWFRQSFSTKSHRIKQQNTGHLEMLPARTTLTLCLAEYVCKHSRCSRQQLQQTSQCERRHKLSQTDWLMSTNIIQTAHGITMHQVLPLNQQANRSKLSSLCWELQLKWVVFKAALGYNLHAYCAYGVS